MYRANNGGSWRQLKKTMKLVLHVQHIVDANKIYCEDYTLEILNSLYSVAPCVPHIFALVCRGGHVVNAAYTAKSSC